MQIVARPAGQRLIVKLNYLLEKNATISVLPKDEFISGKVYGSANQVNDILINAIRLHGNH